MAHKGICVLTPGEAIALEFDGVAPHCSQHRHVDRDFARLLTGGSDLVPWLDPDFAKTGYISERVARRSDGTKCAPAQWATLQDGTQSAGHIVMLREVRWQGRGGVIQLLPIGAMRQRMKRTKTRCRRPISYSLTQCRDTNEIQQEIQARR